MVFLLKDMEEKTVDAVIISKTSTAKEIQIAVDKAKKIKNYHWGDIVNALPDDCEIAWSSELETILY